MTTQHDHQLTGPAAADFTRLASFTTRTGFAGIVLTDPHCVRRVLSR
jgi:hypothetical protein